MQTRNINIKKIGAVIALAIAVFFLYETWCPLEQVIGIPCPGCNMLSALYHLLHGDIQTAMFFHPLIIIFCIYALIEGILYVKYHHLKSRTAHYVRFMFMFLLLIVYLYRMVTIFPNYPMLFNEESILAKIIHLFK